jgi:type II secretory pathway component PulF
MAVFAYRALDARHLPVDGTVAADTPRQARDVLRARGLLVEALREHVTAVRTAGGGRRAPSFAGAWAGRRAATHVPAFVRQLATLLAVGAPMLEALDTIARQHAGRFRQSVLLLRESVAAGGGLAAAMARQPDVFDPLCVSLAQVGEDAGTLDAALLQLAAFQDRSRQFRGKIGTALLYPAVVLVTAVAVSLFLMTFVVPQILGPLLELGRPLPMPTRVVKAASDLLVGDWPVIAAAVAVVAAGLWLAFGSERGRRARDAALLRLPVVGDLVRKQAVVRLAVVLGTLLRGGLVFVRALQVAAEATPNRVVRAALVDCGAAVSAGGDIAASLEGTGAFPPLVVHLFALGQQSGKLDDLLDQLAVAYEVEVSAASNRLASLLEPAMILMLAGLVLTVVMAVMLPVLEAGDVLQ